jgi:phosphoribosylanthranilate isomerase
MEIKVCGITSVEQLKQLQELNVHYAGLIFHEGSKRFAREKLKDAGPEIHGLDIARIGVFVNATRELIERAVEEYELTGVQLHGDESPEFCKELMQKVNVIKAFPIDVNTDIDAVTLPYHESCNYYLFDRMSESYGGSGVKFDWDLLDKALVNKLFFLSGGIGPDDAETIRNFYHPFFYAIDINSRFETAPGQKDMEMISRFISELTADETNPEIAISLGSD